MSAVTAHLPKVAYLDWSEFSHFDLGQKEQAVKMLREATQYVERLTLRQSIAEAAQNQQVKDGSVWAAFWLLWSQIRDGNPHSERQLMMVIDQWEADQGWTARACRELITSAIDAYHTERIERACALFLAWGPNVKAMLLDEEDHLHTRLGPTSRRGHEIAVGRGAGGRAVRGRY